MRVPKKLYLNLMVLTLAIGTVFVSRLAVSESRPEGLIHHQARFKGSAEAPIKIIEYLDYQCPSCAKAEAYLRDVYNRHPSQLFIEARYFPLANHKHSLKAAAYAECAARQDRFWILHQRLFETQSAWEHEDNPAKFFKELVEAGGLDAKKMDRCTDDSAITQMIKKEKDEAKRLGINSTPSFYVNGQLVVGFEALKRKLELLLLALSERAVSS